MERMQMERMLATPADAERFRHRRRRSGKRSISSDSVRQAPTPARIGEDDLHVAHMALQEGSPALGEVKGPEPEKLGSPRAA